MTTKRKKKQASPELTLARQRNFDIYRLEGMAKSLSDIANRRTEATDELVNAKSYIRVALSRIRRGA